MKTNWSIWILRSSGFLTVLGALSMWWFFQTAKMDHFSTAQSIIERDSSFFLWYLGSGILLVVGLFVVCTWNVTLLSPQWRWIGQIAWFVHLSGICLLVLYLFAQGIILPLAYGVGDSQSGVVFWNALDQLEQSLSHLQTYVIPSNFAIGGLLYCIVLFRDPRFQSSIRFIHFSLWTGVLLSSLLCHFGIPDISIFIWSILFPVATWWMGSVKNLSDGAKAHII